MVLLIILIGIRDGKSSNEESTFHRYLKLGTYQPKVTVFDEKGGKAQCPNAWVIINE